MILYKHDVSFSIFSFSYEQNLHQTLLNAPATTTSEKLNLLRTKCKETLLMKGTKHVEQIKKFILCNNACNYLVLYCDFMNDFMFSPNEKIIEILLNQKGKAIFRILSKNKLQLPEIMFYLIYKKLDINEITPRSRSNMTDMYKPSTRFF